MRKTLLTLFLLTAVAVSAQAPAVQFTRSYGGTDYEIAHAVSQTNDGGYILAGSAQSVNGDLTTHHGNQAIADLWVVKTSAGGSLQWQVELGGLDEDIATSARQTADGGYIISGYTNSNQDDVIDNHSIGMYDMWIIKLTSSGAVSWKKCYGFVDDDYAYSVRQTTDGGYIVAGILSGSDSGVHRGALVKLDSGGNVAWSNFYYDGSELRDVYPTTDGGYMAAGTYNGNFWLLKVGSAGAVVSSHTYGGTNQEQCNGFCPVSDGGYVLAGSTLSNDGDVTGYHGSSDYWVVKTNANGVLQWQKTLGGAGLDYGQGAKEDSTGGILVAGSSASSDGDVTPLGNGDAWLVRLTSAGAIDWQQSYGTADNSEQIYGMDYTADQAVVMAGLHHPTGTTNFYLVKLAGTCPLGPPATTQTVCVGSTVSQLTANGINLQWYADQVGGSPLSGSTTVTAGTYYVSQTVEGCESVRTPMTVNTVNAFQPAAGTNQNYCGSATVADLQAVPSAGGTIYWYNVANGGTPLAPGDNVTTGTYYVAQHIGNCESPRKTVNVTITVSNPPSIASTNICLSGPITISQFNTTFFGGGNIHWYTAETGGSIINISTQVQSGTTYYISQIINNCTSVRGAYTFNLSVPVAPSVSQANTTLTINSPLAGYTYFWVTCPTHAFVDGIPANQLSFTPTQSGDYAAIGFDPAGCGAYGTCFTVNLLGTAENAKPALTLFPNPVTSELHFSGIDGSVSYRIVNMLGQELMNGMATDQMVSVSSLSSGAYLIEINADGRHETQRFIKQ